MFYLPCCTLISREISTSGKSMFSFDQSSLLINVPYLVRCTLATDARNVINRVQTQDERTDPLTAKIFALKDEE
jgi:hypothetical protein